MNAMILAAGFGTRLLPHTNRLPKPLFPVLGKTLLQTAIETALSFNPGRIVVNTHHLGGLIEDWLSSRDFGVEIILSHEESILGTAGGIKNAQRWLSGGDFAVINSDIIADMDWAALENFHKDKGAVATLALRPNPDTSKYGPLCVNGGGKVVRYVKTTGPGYKDDLEKYMFTGLSVLSPAIFEKMPAGKVADISSEVYAPMTSKGEGLCGMVTNSRWIDVGTAQDYYSVVMDSLKANGGSIIHPPLPDSTKMIEPVYVEKGAIIGENCVIGPCASIHAGAVVGDGCAVKNCVVLPGSILEKGTLVSEGIV